MSEVDGHEAAPSSALRTAPIVRWWDPGQPDWWVAALFSLGSICFAAGAMPPYASWVGAEGDGVTYFVGSIFFTVAAWLQLMVSVGAVRPGTRVRRAHRWRALVRAPHRAAWWAGVVQLVGTLLFNLSTWEALHLTMSATKANHRVWTPDALGSIAFLVASALAFEDVARPWLRWKPTDLGWSVTMLNMVGSIAFGASAIGARVVTGTDQLRNAEVANVGTFIGAICFLAGAVLLIPEEDEKTFEEEWARC